MGMPAIAMVLLMFCSESEPPGLTGEARKANNDQKRRERLVQALERIPVLGTRLGPLTAIKANKETAAVVREGAAIVPVLVAALDRSSYRQTVWIVFCLSELRATSAKARLVKLKEEEDRGRFASEPHDFTLSYEIKNYLRVVEDMEKKRTQ